MDDVPPDHPAARDAGGAVRRCLFTLSLDNTVISAFVQVSDDPVAGVRPVRVAQRLRPEIAAVSTIMLLLTLLSLTLVWLVLRRAGDSSSQIAATMTGN